MSEREPFEDLDRPRPVRLRDPQADHDNVTLIDALEHLEPAPLLIQVCKAANDLPTGASGGRLLDVGPVDGPPHDGAIQKLDPEGELPASERVVGVTNHLVAPRHHA